jgi:tRNA-dihydrouridine synthase B
LTKGIVLPKPDFREVEKMILRHAGLVVGLKGEFTGIREMRKQVAWYTAGYPGSAKFRSKMNDLESMDDLIRLVEDYEKQLEL